MKRQADYDEAVALLEKLEGILGTELSVFGYDGEDPRRELWYQFATEEEIETRREERRKQEEQYCENNPYAILSKKTAEWAEKKILEHSEPLVLFKRPVPYGTEEKK